MKTIRNLICGVVLMAAATSANSASFLGNDGVWYGNVCRTGPYFSVIAFGPIGMGCWNYGWGMQGIITAN